MEELHEILKVLQTSSFPAVLATIIRVEGSAYRKEGTCMLLLPDGSEVGVLSAGCLEVDLAARAQAVLASGESRTFVYDMSAEDDLSWGQGAGCNGVIHVLLEPVDAALRGHLLQMQACLAGGLSVLVVKRLTADGAVAGYGFLPEIGPSFGKWDGSTTERLETLRDELWERMKVERQNGVRAIPGLAEAAYWQLVQPKPRLVLFGAGPDAKPLATFAAQAGFSVTVADWRPAACSVTHFPQADVLVQGLPAELVEQIPFTPRDSVVIMTHNFQRDQELLQLLRRKQIGYLGVLGPRRRTMRLLGEADVPEEVHSPVGLPIGAEGPEEIAVSILAEVIQKRRRFATERVPT